MTVLSGPYRCEMPVFLRPPSSPLPERRFKKTVKKVLALSDYLVLSLPTQHLRKNLDAHGPKCKTPSRLARSFDRVLPTSIEGGLREMRALSGPDRCEMPVFLRPPRSPLSESR